MQSPAIAQARPMLAPKQPLAAPASAAPKGGPGDALKLNYQAKAVVLPEATPSFYHRHQTPILVGAGVGAGLGLGVGATYGLLASTYFGAGATVLGAGLGLVGGGLALGVGLAALLWAKDRVLG